MSADPAQCSFQFNPTGVAKFTSSCDIAKQVLAGSSVSYENEAAPAGTAATVKIGDKVIPGFEAKGLPADELKAKDDAFKKELARGDEGSRLPGQGRSRSRS